MSDTAFAPTVERKPGRMRNTTADAADRAMVMIEHDGLDPKVALVTVGISRRSYQRYIESITAAAPETARPLGGSQSAPAPLPLFPGDSELARRVDEIQRRLAELELAWEEHKLSRRTAASHLVDAANELADWPPA